MPLTFRYLSTSFFSPYRVFSVARKRWRSVSSAWAVVVVGVYLRETVLFVESPRNIYMYHVPALTYSSAICKLTCPSLLTQFTCLCCCFERFQSGAFVTGHGLAGLPLSQHNAPVRAQEARRVLLQEVQHRGVARGDAPPRTRRQPHRGRREEQSVPQQQPHGGGIPGAEPPERFVALVRGVHHVAVDLDGDGAPPGVTQSLSCAQWPSGVNRRPRNGRGAIAGEVPRCEDNQRYLTVLCDERMTCTCVSESVGGWLGVAGRLQDAGRPLCGLRRNVRTMRSYRSTSIMELFWAVVEIVFLACSERETWIAFGDSHSRLIESYVEMGWFLGYDATNRCYE